MRNMMSMPEGASYRAEFESPGGCALNPRTVADWYQKAREFEGKADQLNKAYTTGLPGIEQPGDATSYGPGRTQYLYNKLERTSYEMPDARGFQEFRKERCYSTTFEWSQFNNYGGPGDGFVPETGASTDQSSGLFFGVLQGNDTFTRLLQQVKFMAATRFISVPDEKIRNIEDPRKVARDGMVLEIIAKADLALYHGDSKTNLLQINGVKRQLLDWLTPGALGATYPGHPEDQVICYDAGGAPLDKSLFLDISSQSRLKYGKLSLCIQSILGNEDTQASLFPELRASEGLQGVFGVDVDEFRGPNGRIRLVGDPMLRANQPLAADGPTSNGLPRATGDAGGLTWSSGTQGWVASAGANGCQVVAVPTAPAPTTYFWQNRTLNTDTAQVAIPPLPSGAGNQANRLTQNYSYYYAASIVYQGLESQAWVVGQTSANFNASTGLNAFTGTPTPFAVVSATPIVQLEFLATAITLNNVAITSSIYSQAKLRIYRYGGPSQTAAPTLLSQFSFLDECGVNTVGSNPRLYDNGFRIAGYEDAFFFTEKKNGVNGVFIAQLLPLIQREGLPNLMMATPLGMLYFWTFVMLSPRHHFWARNVGPGPNRPS